MILRLQQKIHNWERMWEMTLEGKVSLPIILGYKRSNKKEKILEKVIIEFNKQYELSNSKRNLE